MSNTTITRIRRSADMPLAVKRMAAQELIDYTRNKRALAEYYADETPSPVQHYSPTSGVQSGNSESRPTEIVSMQMLEDPYHLHLMQSIKAVDTVYNHGDDLDKRLLRLVYIAADKISAEAAADMVGLHPVTAYKRINAALKEIAELMGYIPADNGRK